MPWVAPRVPSYVASRVAPVVVPGPHETPAQRHVSGRPGTPTTYLGGPPAAARSTDCLPGAAGTGGNARRPGRREPGGSIRVRWSRPLGCRGGLSRPRAAPADARKGAWRRAEQLNKTIARYGRVDLLCIDELGYMELDRHGAELLFQVLTEREEKNSVAIASNESFGGWTKTFTDPRLCAAIVDRLTFNGTIIETGTDSYRLASTRARAEEPAKAG
ncbi:hypothetical protein GCM10010524_40650 [Streptomyces mexicanus]